MIELDSLEIREKEFDKAISLIRGVIKKFVDLGYDVKGFDAYTTSNVLKGSGLSSSAAFEVLVGTIINGLFANNEVNPIEIAKFGQFPKMFITINQADLWIRWHHLSVRLWLLILRVRKSR